MNGPALSIGRTVIAAPAVPLTSNAPRLISTLPLLSPEQLPWLVVQETRVELPGIVFEMVTPAVRVGPPLVAVRLNVTSWPTGTMFELEVLVIDKSARFGNRRNE